MMTPKHSGLNPNVHKMSKPLFQVDKEEGDSCSQTCMVTSKFKLSAVIH